MPAIVLKKLYGAFPRLKPENVLRVMWWDGVDSPLSEEAAAAWIPAAQAPG